MRIRVVGILALPVAVFVFPYRLCRNRWCRSRVHQDRSFAITEGDSMTSTVLIIILVLLVMGALPTWNHSRSWGYAPSGVLSLVLVVLLVLALMGRL
jgi:hypothetical protein